MIQALSRNKSTANFNEDALTSTVFGHLFLLSDELFWTIIKDSIYENGELLVEKIETQKVDFWPRWNSEGTDNSVSVEPDIFIQTNLFDLIIEAKRYDENQQCEDQWRKEIVAYKNEYAKDKKTKYLLALGGINEEENSKVDDTIIFKTRWTEILKKTIDLLENKAKTILISKIERKILENLKKGFALFGYSYVITWFNEIKKEEIDKLIGKKDIKMLLNKQFKQNDFFTFKDLIKIEINTDNINKLKLINGYE